MHRFFVDKNKINDETVIIDGDDVNHICKVLRLQVGEQIQICNGQGMDYIVVIEQMDKKQVMGSIIEAYQSLGESAVFVTLYQGIPKGSKMDSIIQKCTEMGVSKIVPVITKRTVVKLETKKDEEKKVERWTKIAEEAAKQSKRGIVPEIAMPLHFEQAIEQGILDDLAIIPYELEEENRLKIVLQQYAPKTLAIFIGPEGGFDEVEVSLAQSKKVIPITLGKRILRTESAGMAVIANAMYQYEQ